MIIRTLGDVKLVPTPVTYSVWKDGGRVDEVREEMRASLFAGCKPATAITSGAYGQFETSLRKDVLPFSHWREIARRFHAAAGADVWLDTTEASCEWWSKRNREERVR